MTKKTKFVERQIGRDFVESLYAAAKTADWDEFDALKNELAEKNKDKKCGEFKTIAERITFEIGNEKMDDGVPFCTCLITDEYAEILSEAVKEMNIPLLERAKDLIEQTALENKRLAIIPDAADRLSRLAVRTAELENGMNITELYASAYNDIVDSDNVKKHKEAQRFARRANMLFSLKLEVPK